MSHVISVIAGLAIVGLIILIFEKLRRKDEYSVLTPPDAHIAYISAKSKDAIPEIGTIYEGEYVCSRVSAITMKDGSWSIIATYCKPGIDFSEAKGVRFSNEDLRG